MGVFISSLSNVVTGRVGDLIDPYYDVIFKGTNQKLRFGGFTSRGKYLLNITI